MRFLNAGLAAAISAAVLTLAACGGGGSGGNGPSVPVPVVPPPALSVPSAPTNLVAIAGNALANLAFTAPDNNGGSAVSGYTVSSNPAGGVDLDAGSSALNHVVTGLSNGVSYTFTVTATNAAGVGAASSPSNAVTPSQAAQWSATGSLQVTRAGHTATLLPDGKVLVVGSALSAPGAASSSVELYDPATKVWKVVGQTSIDPYGHTATLLPNGKLLIDFQVYDPANNTMTAIPTPFKVGNDLVGSRGNAAVLLQNGKVLVTGGALFETASRAALLFDPANNTWADARPMAVVRSGHKITLLNDGRALVYGRSSGAELYDPASNTWTAAAKPPIAHYAVSATLLPNGKVLFIPGLGVDGQTAERKATLYDPATNTWTLAGTISADHVNHTATLLTNGTVLLVGGGRYAASTGFTAGTDVVELYDPVTNTWSVTHPLIVGPRAGHTATLLRDGSVLVVGGAEIYGWSQPTSADAALYEPL